MGWQPRPAQQDNDMAVVGLHVLAVIAGIVFVTLFIHALDGFDIPAPDGPGPNTGPSP